MVRDNVNHKVHSTTVKGLRKSLEIGSSAVVVVDIISLSPCQRGFGVMLEGACTFPVANIRGMPHRPQYLEEAAL